MSTSETDNEIVMAKFTSDSMPGVETWSSTSASTLLSPWMSETTSGDASIFSTEDLGGEVEAETHNKPKEKENGPLTSKQVEALGMKKLEECIIHSWRDKYGKLQFKFHEPSRGSRWRSFQKVKYHK